MSKQEISLDVAEEKVSGIYRILSLILGLIAIVSLFLPLNVVVGSFELQQESVLTAILGAAKEGGTCLFLPIPAATSTVGSLAGLALYFLLITSLVSVVLTVISYFNAAKSKGLLIANSIVFTMGWMVYAISILCISAYVSEMAIDIVSIALTLVGLLLYIIIALNLGKTTFLNFVQYLITIVFTVFVLTSVTANAENVMAAAEGIWGTILAVAMVLAVANLCYATARLHHEDWLKQDLVRYIVEGVIAILVLVAAIVGSIKGSTTILFAGIAILIAVLQILLNGIQRKRVKAIEEEAAAEAEAEAIAEAEALAEEETFEVEEYVEAFPYEGGPIDGVVLAEEVHPVALGVGPVSTAGYDFYNCKSFDAFIATLNEEERNQFTELFILRYKGSMSEIPDYVVGGDNKDFFRKLFIYLGQYRDRIPEGLLVKMYNYSVRVS